MTSAMQLEKLVRNLSLTWADVINNANFTLESNQLAPVHWPLVLLLMAQGTESGQMLIYPAVAGCLKDLLK